MATNLFKQNDKFEIITNLELDEVVNRINSVIYIDNKFRIFDPIFKTSKKFYGLYYPPYSWSIKNNNFMTEGLTGKNKTKITTAKTSDNTTTVSFKIENIGTKLMLFIMAIPFIFIGFFITSMNNFEFGYEWFIFLFPILILAIGIVAINFKLYLKKEYFKELLQ
jgi:hypothetical protein